MKQDGRPCGLTVPPCSDSFLFSTKSAYDVEEGEVVPKLSACVQSGSLYMMNDTEGSCSRTYRRSLLISSRTFKRCGCAETRVDSFTRPALQTPEVVVDS